MLEILQIETTNYCNAKCIFCAHNQIKEHGVMSNTLYSKIVAEASKLDPPPQTFIPMLTGEPFLDLNMITRIKEARAALPTTEIHLYTNGLTRLTVADSLVTLDSSVDFVVAATKRAYLDGGGDTYIRESAANVITFTTGGSDRASLNGSGTFAVVSTGALAGDFNLSSGSNATVVSMRSSADGCTQSILNATIAGNIGGAAIFQRTSGSSASSRGCVEIIDNANGGYIGLGVNKASNTGVDVWGIDISVANVGAGAAIGINLSNPQYAFQFAVDATDPTGGGGPATGRVPVWIGGATRYLAYY